MARYLVRVELFNAEEDDYNQLHERLEKIGLSRKIETKYGFYDMPPGTYFGTNEESSTTEMREWVSHIASRHSHEKTAAVFLAKVEEWDYSLHWS